MVFPGVCGAWVDEATALAQKSEVKGRHQVLFKFNGKVAKPAGDKLHVFNRQFAKIESLKAAEGKDAKHQVCTLTNFTDHVFKTMKEYVGAIGGAVAAGKEAVDAAKGKDDDPPKDDPPKDDPPADPPKDDA